MFMYLKSVIRSIMNTLRQLLVLINIKYLLFIQNMIILTACCLLKFKYLCVTVEFIIECFIFYSDIALYLEFVK